MSIKYIRKHYCSLDLKSEKFLLDHGPVSPLCRRLRSSLLIWHRHPATYRHFRSYPALVAERHRQLAEGGSCSIHPLSCFSLYWNSFMALVSISHICVSWFRLTFVLHPPGRRPELHWFDLVLLALHLICFSDIVIKFYTGFLERNSIVVFNKLQCACHYIQRYFFIDLISCLPISFFLLFYEVNRPRYILIGHVLPLIRTVSIYRDLKNFVTFIKKFNSSYVVYSTLRNILLFLLSAHWLSCLAFTHGAILYYWTGTWPRGFHMFLTYNSTSLPNMDIGLRYKKAAFITLSALFGTGYSVYQIYEPIEILFNTFTIFYSIIFLIYALVFLIKVYFTKYNSVIRYAELMNQLQEYMRRKQFPPALTKRVTAFYYYRYQGSYFREEGIMATLSDQLRNEIALHTCHKLIKKVSLFEDLPADAVGSMLGCLRPEVYLPNDPVVRAGDIGDCMYLIASGTVAVYSLKGVEVCHLEDGAYFGEIALLMKDSKRVATVVAVEITQVYRLDAEHFRYFIDTYEALHLRIEALASQRMHETVVLDEAFKRNRDHAQSASRLDLYHDNPNFSKISQGD